MSANPFKRVAIVCVFVCALILGGCSTAGKSVGLGAGLGGGTGMAIGAIADPGQNGQYRTRNIIIGGALGAMTGMIAGSVIHSSTEKDKAEAFKAGQAMAPPSIDPNEQPKLIQAQWRAEVVEAKRIGNRFVPKHVEYIITDQARWEDPQ
jgi:ABC-type uncharacterized transport system auxiliary subunit